MVINRVNRMTIKDPEAISKIREGRGIQSRTSSGPGTSDEERYKAPSLSQSPSRGGGGGAAGDNESLERAHPSQVQVESRKGITSKKMYCILSFGAYAALCFLFFSVDLGIWFFLCFSKVQYFIRPSNTAYFFSVVPDAYWIIIKFLVGAAAHFFLAVFIVLLLIGVRSIEDFVLKHQERLLLWITAVATCFEYFMFQGSIEYLGSNPTVNNGNYRDTVLPPEPPPAGVDDCHPLSGHNASEARSVFDAEAVKQVRVNLKWMVSISCEYWDRHVPPAVGISADCVNYRHKMVELKDKDCSKADLVRNVILSMLSLNSLGLLFCCGCLFLYFRAVVRTSPGRFSFDESTFQTDVEQLKQVAERVRKYTHSGASKNPPANVRRSKPALEEDLRRSSQEAIVANNQRGSVVSAMAVSSGHFDRNMRKGTL